MSQTRFRVRRGPGRSSAGLPELSCDLLHGVPALILVTCSCGPRPGGTTTAAPSATCSWSGTSGTRSRRPRGCGSCTASAGRTGWTGLRWSGWLGRWAACSARARAGRRGRGGPALRGVGRLRRRLPAGPAVGQAGDRPGHDRGAGPDPAGRRDGAGPLRDGREPRAGSIADPARRGSEVESGAASMLRTASVSVLQISSG
jgi:hypothetical protein